MKKLMIAAAIALAAVASQAASIDWSSGGLLKAPKTSSDGTFSSTAAADNSMNMYVFIIGSDAAAAATYAALTAESIWSTYGSQLASADGKTAAAFGKSGGTAVTDGLAYSDQATTTYYAAIITTYKGVAADGTTADMYVANKATGTINTAGAGVGPSNLTKKWEGSGTGLAWTAAAVPEPTSGLLLLLGVAGLALRRRRA